MTDNKDDNRLIAEWMGAKVVPVEKFGGGLVNRIDFPDGEHKWEHHLAYDISWDWLMPVVERIEAMGQSFEISGTAARIYYEDIETTGPTKLTATYTAILAFIKHYNKEKGL